MARGNRLAILAGLAVAVIAAASVISLRSQPKSASSATSSVSKREDRSDFPQRAAASLRSVVGDADRVVGAVDATTSSGESRRRRIFTIRGQPRVAALVESLEFRFDPNAACMCMDPPSLDFYRGDELVAQVEVLHGEVLAWEAGYKALTPDSSKAIKQLFAQYGFRDL